MASGGSEANLIALKCARDSVAASIKDRGVRTAPGDLVIYASEQCHYSIDKSADILGLGRDGLRKIPTDDRFHISLDALREAIARDRDKGLFRVVLLVLPARHQRASSIHSSHSPRSLVRMIAGITSMRLTVDHSRSRRNTKHKLRGIELADSITFDPHKWMFVPFSCGATLVRDGGRVLRDAFDMSPEYLSEDRGGADVEFDFFRYGQMGTRRFNSLKLWMAIKFMGREGYARTVERQIDLTKYLAKQIDSLPDFKRVGEVETAVCCFRFVPKPDLEWSGADRLQQRLQQVIERSGEAWLTTTVVRGRRAMRVNINSFLTEQHHIDDLIKLLVRSKPQVYDYHEVDSEFLTVLVCVCAFCGRSPNWSEVSSEDHLSS